MRSARIFALIVAAAAVVAAGPSAARNTPCSGKKGGVVGCQGEKFLCRNGTLSKSKQTCSRAAAASESEDPPDDEEGKALR